MMRGVLLSVSFTSYVSVVKNRIKQMGDEMA